MDDLTINDDTTESPGTAKCPKCGLALKTENRYCEHCGAPTGLAEPVPRWHLHRRLYDWVLSFAHHRHSMTALFILSFAESSFFPVPPDVLLMPLTLGNRKKWLRLATVCSVASVLGAVAGFMIGWLAWEGIGGFFHDHVPGFERDSIVLVDGQDLTGFVNQESLHVDDMLKVQHAFPLKLSAVAEPLAAEQVSAVNLNWFTKVGKLYEAYNFLVVFTAGFTPIPFKVITITAGIFGTSESVSNPIGFFAIFVLAAAISRSARFFMVAGLMRLFGARIMPFIDRYLGLLTLAFVVLLVGGFYVLKVMAH
jgi:membrane protein YqaA with SNARE-associated domain/ribosomal protein L32